MSATGGVILLIVAFVIYFLPSIVAESRRKATGTGGVLLVNLLFGWTLIGWLLAFVWACSGKTDHDVRAEQRRHDELMAALAAARAPPAPAQPVIEQRRETRLANTGFWLNRVGR